MAKPDKKTVPGPYDTRFMTKREKEREAQRIATDAVEEVKNIDARRQREELAARGITKSFQDMLAQQANAQASRLSAIQGAAGQNVGSGTLAASIVGTTQAAEQAPRIAAGRGTEIQADVNARASQARKERAQDFRKYLTQARQDVETMEREKQAAQIEGAATAKAYDLKLQDYNRDVYESDRDYELALAKFENDLAKADTGDISDLIPTLTQVAKDASAKKGTGAYEGEVTYVNAATGKTETLPVSGVNFSPANKSVAERDAFWKKYVEKATGTRVQGVPVRKVQRGETKRSPIEVAQIMFDATSAIGSFSREEIYRAILKTPFGIMNSSAVRAAYRA